MTELLNSIFAPIVGGIDDKPGLILINDPTTKSRTATNKRISRISWSPMTQRTPAMLIAVQHHSICNEVRVCAWHHLSVINSRRHSRHVTMTSLLNDFKRSQFTLYVETRLNVTWLEFNPVKLENSQTKSITMNGVIIVNYAGLFSLLISDWRLNCTKKENFWDE